MARNYLQPVNDHFDMKNEVTLEDVDDDIFLNNSRSHSSMSARSGSAASLRGAAAPKRSTNPFDEDIDQQQQAYMERRREIESRTLDSSQRSLSLLYETEETGIATARELAKQREQLEKTARHLDEINTTLRFSQRHLNGLKSVFGGLKNYLAGNRDTQSPRMTSSPSNSQFSNDQGAASTNSGYTATSNKPAMSPDESYETHPINRLRNEQFNYNEHQQQMQQQQRSRNPFEAQLESNLEDMCENLSRLKFLATDLNTEIESQNELLDNMNYKIEDIDLKMSKQNKDINKLLGKK